VNHALTRASRKHYNQYKHEQINIISNEFLVAVLRSLANATNCSAYFKHFYNQIAKNLNLRSRYNFVIKTVETEGDRDCRFQKVSRSREIEMNKI
jgi:hypothetical protein